MPIYLDNASTTFPKPETVYKAVEHALKDIGVGPARGGYRRGMEANRLVFEARERVAELFRVTDSSRIVFTHSATESLNLAISGLLRPGDHVVTTAMEHNSLVRPLWRAAGNGVEISWVEPDRTGYVAASRIASAIRPNTRMVAMSHCSNVCGAIQPVEEIGLLAKRAGAVFLVDGAQSAGRLPIDVNSMMIDLLAAPGHKGLYGIPGTGVLYIAHGLEPDPLMVGGTGGHSTGPEQPAAMPERYESGTLNTTGIASLKAGVEYILETGMEVIRSKEEALGRLLRDGLSGLPGVTIHGPDEPDRCGGIVSFTMAGTDPATIGFLLDRDFDISVRVGLHCAYSAHKAIGTWPAGTVRVSPGYFNTEEDINAFLEAVENVSAGR